MRCENFTSALLYLLGTIIQTGQKSYAARFHHAKGKRKKKFVGILKNNNDAGLFISSCHISHPSDNLEKGCLVLDSKKVQSPARQSQIRNKEKTA